MFIDLRERERGREGGRHIDVRETSIGCLPHAPSNPGMWPDQDRIHNLSAPNQLSRPARENLVAFDKY